MSWQGQYGKSESPSKPITTIHYNDVIMSAIASQITSLTIVYSTVYSGTVQRKHQNSALLAFVRGLHRWPVNSPHKGPVTRKMFPSDDVIMCLKCLGKENMGNQNPYPNQYHPLEWRIFALEYQKSITVHLLIFFVKKHESTFGFYVVRSHGHVTDSKSLLLKETRVTRWARDKMAYTL